MQVRCQSGLMGERSFLQDRYDNFGEFKMFCRVYSIHRKLKFRSMIACWRANPLIESSTNPSDLRVVPESELTHFRYVRLPKADCDVVIVFPGGDELQIQARPSNADVGYNGSLDIILPEDTSVCNWAGDDMQAAPPVDKRRCPHIRMAKQLVAELPGNYDRNGDQGRNKCR